MGYNVPTKKNRETIKEQWDRRQPDYITDLSAKEIKNMGGSGVYGKGGRWESNNEYIAINGHKSRGGIPLKLMTKSGEIPISTTDAKKLSDYLNPY